MVTLVSNEQVYFHDLSFLASRSHRRSEGKEEREHQRQYEEVIKKVLCDCKNVEIFDWKY